MNYDFAIVYWGLMRTIKKTHQSQLNNIFKVLDENNITYKTFMHTWKLKNNKQHIWNTTITKEIDYDEYKLLPIDFYKIQKQQKFLDKLNLENYFNKQNGIIKSPMGKIVSNFSKDMYATRYFRRYSTSINSLYSECSNRFCAGSISNTCDAQDNKIFLNSSRGN